MHLPSNSRQRLLAPQLKALLAIFAALALAGCEVIGDIFQAGFWTGVVIVAVVVAIAVFAIRMLR